MRAFLSGDWLELNLLGSLPPYWAYQVGKRGNAKKADLSLTFKHNLLKIWYHWLQVVIRLVVSRSHGMADRLASGLDRRQTVLGL